MIMNSSGPWNNIETRLDQWRHLRRHHVFVPHELEYNRKLWERAEVFLFEHMKYAYCPIMLNSRLEMKRTWGKVNSEDLIGVIWGETRIRRMLETRVNTDLAGVVARYINIRGLTRVDETKFLTFLLDKQYRFLVQKLEGLDWEWQETVMQRNQVEQKQKELEQNK